MVMSMYTNLPLAARMRARNLKEFIGQEHIVGKNKLLYRAIIADRIGSAIFYGPPGTGKTTLAKVISNETQYLFKQLNATTVSVKEIRQLGDEAGNPLLNPKKKIILFLDEIHRLNKAQQDVLLPYVENGLFILIGATTENPYFEVNSALLSRSTIYRFNLIDQADIVKLLHMAIVDKERGFGDKKIFMTEQSIEHIALMSSGDARKALNALELAVLTTEPDDKQNIRIDIEVAEECIQKKSLRYDKNGDQHYDIISAFIKSLRNYMEPDAVLHWLARLIQAGEDPKFIARRIIISAAEDVGLANPLALQVAVAASQAVERIGWPEGQIILAEAALYVACSPKSNASYQGICQALKDIDEKEIGEVPKYLRDAHYHDAKELGNGIGYKYSHDFPNARAEGYSFLPKELENETYYQPKDIGVESKIKKNLETIRMTRE